jgi:hypothetical protein
MKTFARIIAAIFMVLGLMIIITGASIAVFGLFGSRPAAQPTPSIIPDMTGLLIMAKLVAGGAIGFQGLMLSAIGEVLWLLAAISDQTQRESEYMGLLIRRLSPSNQ